MLNICSFSNIFNRTIYWLYFLHLFVDYFKVKLKLLLIMILFDILLFIIMYYFLTKVDG